DDDNPPLVNVSTASTVEGGSLAFTVSLSQASGKPITVSYATADGTATVIPGVGAPDYVTATGVLAFAPGQLSQPVSVTTLDDAVYEGVEYMFLGLSAPSNVQIGASPGTGTITDNETAPTIAINDVTFAESDGATKFFTVTLSGSASTQVTVDFTTAPF